VLLLVRLGVFPELLAGFDDVVERDMYHAAAEVDVGDLDGAQLAPSHAGDRGQPQVQRDVTLIGGTGTSLVDHVHDGGRRGGSLLLRHRGRSGGIGRIPVDPLPTLGGLERAGQDAVDDVRCCG
jgi:hypothetical protein